MRPFHLEALADMTESTTKQDEEKHPLCTCDLEPAFIICPDGNEPNPWLVMDCEGEIMAECSEERFARIIVDSLNDAVDDDLNACVIHEWSQR